MRSWSYHDCGGRKRAGASHNFRNLGVTFAALMPLFLYGQQQKANEKALYLRGIVDEFGLSKGIADVQVEVERYHHKPSSSLTPKTHVGSATTDLSGAFAFSFTTSGTYRVTVLKDGYVMPGSFADGFSLSAEVNLDSGNSKQEVRFQLARPAEISGQVLDEDTQQPVVGLPVAAGQYGYEGGRARLWPSGVGATTGMDGRFVLRGLTPTNYVVAIGPMMRPAFAFRQSPELKTVGAEDRLMAEFSEGDIEKIDLDYDSTYWPGGFDSSAATPVLLISGAQIDLGRLYVKKVTKYRIVLSLLGNGCTGSDTVTLAVKAVSNPLTLFSAVVGSLRCGTSGLIRGFVPGSYELEALVVTASRPDVTITASTPFTIGREAVRISLPLQPGMQIDGKAVLSEGARPLDFGSIRLLLQPVRYGAIRHALISLAGDGTFRIENVGARDYRLRVSGVPGSHYVREVRHNGQKTTGGVISIDSYGLANSMEIEFDEKPAGVIGSVIADEKPVRQAFVVLMPWPYGTDVFSAMLTTTGDENGKFTLSGVAPGDYRILAIRPEAQRLLHRPGVMEHLLSAAEKVSLATGQVRNVLLKATSP